jgi:3-dehydroquinate dehydratase-2
MPSTVFILNGPNLNLLGQREPEIYGTTSLEEIATSCSKLAEKLGIEVDFRQTNHEGVLVDWIQEAREKAVGIILNAAAYSHTSYAIPDALIAFNGPIYEVHLSNIFKREAYRHHSTISAVSDGVICGLGAQGYELALEALKSQLNS